MSFPLRESLVAGCIAIDFILAGKSILNPLHCTCVDVTDCFSGNAITQSFMTLPALISDFPPRSSPEHSQRAALLGRQWPICWTVGNNFFRPISTISTLGYAATGVMLYREGRDEWKWFALGALLHVSVIVHSAVNMQPLNDKLTALGGTTSDGKGKVEKQDAGDAVELATKWIRWNY